MSVVKFATSAIEIRTWNYYNVEKP